MRLFITIEAQFAKENGLYNILSDTVNKLSFVTAREKGLEDENNYGSEFRLISIIPTCVDNQIWCGLAWKERKQIWRKKKEADIRLRMNYEHFIGESYENKRLLFINTIVKSIRIVQERAKSDFMGNELIRDILIALDVTQNQLDSL